MKLTYRDMNQLRIGDIVQYINPTPDGPNTAGFKQGEIYIADITLNYFNDIKHIHIYVDQESSINAPATNFRLLQTYPGSSAEVGDLCIYMRRGNGRIKYGELFIVTHLFPRSTGHDVGYEQGFSCDISSCRVVCRAADIGATRLDNNTTEPEGDDTISDAETTRVTHLAHRNIGTMFYKS